MFCRYCGKEVDDEAAVCPSCGKPVSYTSAPDFGDKPPSAEPVYEESVGGSDSFQTYTGSQVYRAEEPAESPALSIVALCLGIASLVLCCCYGGAIGIAGIIVSVIALNGRRKGRGMAVAGLVTSIIGVILFVVMILITLISSLDYDDIYNDIYNGYYDDYGLDAYDDDWL